MFSWHSIAKNITKSQSNYDAVDSLYMEQGICPNSSMYNNDNNNNISIAPQEPDLRGKTNQIR